MRYARPASTMNRFEKDKVIGSGTYGNVWLVRYKPTGLPYVMKDVKLTALDATERQRALAEVAILSKFKHKNIIRYKDSIINHETGVLSIFMEYAFGGDLYTAIQRQRGVRFPEKTVITWFVQICLGLQYIHFQNILHRDLKTQNIFLTKNNVVKIGDFGIARCLRESTELASTAIGTPYYMSPEICQNKPYNFKSDIWALGCVLFEMASLTHPFKANNYANLVILIVNGKRRELPKSCSSLIRELVEMTMKFKAEDRPYTDDILALPELQPYLLGQVTQSRKKSASVSAILNLKSLQIGNRSASNSLTRLTAENRRASIAGGDSSISRPRLSLALKGKDVRTSRSTAFRSQSSKTRSVRVRSPSAGSRVQMGKETGILKPAKREVRKSLSNSSTYILKQMANYKKYDVLTNKEEVDCGYQSEEANRTTSFKMSTLKHDLQAMNLDSNSRRNLIQDDVFESIPNDTNNYKYPFSMCNHDIHCPKCIMDMMWKNRILETERDCLERKELVDKMKTVFDASFDIVYRALITQWKDRSSNIIKEMMDSLSYNQVQHLPLMMQLVQLDMVQKEK